MATVTAFIRISTQGIPPLALTGATFGAPLRSLFYKYGPEISFLPLGEILGTGVVSFHCFLSCHGSLYGICSQTRLWFIYTPRFFGTSLDRYSDFLCYRLSILIKQNSLKSSRIFLRWKDRLMQKLTTNPSLWQPSSLIHCWSGTLKNEPRLAVP